MSKYCKNIVRIKKNKEGAIVNLVLECGTHDRKAAGSNLSSLNLPVQEKVSTWKHC